MQEMATLTMGREDCVSIWDRKEEVDMDLPEGSRLDGMVAKLERCIYGLKQSPWEWYYRLVEYLGPFGFFITAGDPCVLVHESGDLFFALYVDDITCFQLLES